MRSLLKKTFQKIARILKELMSPPWNEWDGFTALLTANFILGPILWNIGGEDFFGLQSIAWLWTLLLASPVLYVIVIALKEAYARRVQ